MAVYNANDEELKRLRQMLLQRSTQQNLEATRADNIAARDERVVAGEDTERGAVTAANLAKAQLGGAAGAGAAALAGMEAAQSARNADFAGLLQRARERKDIFEQKGIDRRIAAFDTQAQASSVEQARNRANAIAGEMQKLQKDWDALQKFILNQRMQERNDHAAQQRDIDGAKAQSIESDFVPQERDVNTNTGDDHSEAYNPKPKQPDHVDLDPQDNSGFEVNMAIIAMTLKEAGFPDSITVDGQTFNLNKDTQNYVLFYPRYFEENPSAPNPANYTRIQWSDANLKEVYKDAGNHAGKAGNAKKNHKKYSAKAEEMFADMGNGLNEGLVKRYGG